MPRFFTRLAVLAVFAAPAAHSAPIAADSQITAVTLYADRAVITRSAALDLPAAGPVEVVFDQLPAGLLDASLQASGRGTASVTLLDVTARPTYVDTTPNDRVKALEDQLRAVARDERTVSDRTAVLAQQREYVRQIQASTASPAKDAPPTVSPEVCQKLFAFTDDQLTKIAAETATLDTQRDDLHAKRTALEQQLAELRGQGGRSYKTVTIRLDASAPGHLDLTLRYALGGVSWTPAYDARVQSNESTVHLTYSGIVRQSTGEDWHGVAVTLSTARPALGGGAPELQPWIVQRREILPVAANADEETVVLSPFAVTADGGKRPRATTLSGTMLKSQLREMAPAPAAVDNQVTSATFTIPDKTDVPSYNTPHKVPIGTIALKADLRYSTTPKLVPAAFLTADVVNTSDFPLLAGAMNVFLDDTFVAASRLRTVMPGEKFDLALGADEGVSIKRRLNNRLTENTGLVNRGQRITYDFTFVLQNNKKAAVPLVLRDQLPVSRHEKIVVKLLAPADLKPADDGTLEWKLTLAPGEKRELPFKFSVEYPNDLPVAGLE